MPATVLSLRTPDRPLLAASALSGAALVSLWHGVGPIALVAGALLGAAIALLTGPDDAPSSDAAPRPARLFSWLERLAPIAGLLWFIPLFRLPLPPGADLSMHAALARSLSESSHHLSPAWPGLDVALYPRGFSALIALAWPLGPGPASLFACAIAMLLWQFGLARVLSSLGAELPQTIALLLALLSRMPQSFFNWGGSPTTLALALGLFAAAELRHAPLLSTLLLAGAAAVHPIGAIAGGLVVAIFAARTRRGISALPLLALLLVLASLNAFGPTLSTRELAWMSDYARVHERVLQGPPWLFPITLFPALGPVWGDGFTALVALSLAVVTWRARSQPLERIRIIVPLVATLALAALLALGPYLPIAGPLLYPGRFAPLLIVALAPLVHDAFLLGHTTHPRIARLALLVSFAWAIPSHARWYERPRPPVSEADLRMMSCIQAQVPADALIDGAPGDASLWIPALTGRAVTHPHEHCALFDELDQAFQDRKPAFRFRGEEARYSDPLPGPDPLDAPLCSEGHARLWRLR